MKILTEEKALKKFTKAMGQFYATYPSASPHECYCFGDNESHLLAQIQFTNGAHVNVILSVPDPTWLGNESFLNYAADLLLDTAAKIKNEMAQLLPREFGQTIH